MRIHRSTCLISLLALLPLCPISAAVKEGRASQLLRSLRESAPDESRAVTVSNVSLKLGLGTLIIEKGVLIPAGFRQFERIGPDAVVAHDRVRLFF